MGLPLRGRAQICNPLAKHGLCLHALTNRRYALLLLRIYAILAIPCHPFGMAWEGMGSAATLRDGKVLRSKKHIFDL